MIRRGLLSLIEKGRIMSLTVTLIIFGAAVVATLVSIVGVRRPRELGQIWTPPYHLILFIGILTLIVMAAHLISLISGHPFAGRSGL